MSPRLLQEYVDQISRLHPEKQAVTDGIHSLSYQDLSLQSNRLARCLIRHGLKQGQHVVLCMPRSIQVTVAMAGVLKADAVYVPMMVDTPALRRRKILNDCRPYAIICDAKSIQKFLEEEPAPEFPVVMVCLDADVNIPFPKKYSVITRRDIDSNDSSALTYMNLEDDPACIYYTSGSTGDPKGVIITHRNIDEYVAWAVEYIGIDKEDRILGTAPFHFDMSLFDVYCSQRAAATLCIAGEKTLLFPTLLVKFAEAEKVTLWKGVSSLLMYLARMGALSKGRLATLRKVLFSGEVFPTKYLMQWMDTFPDKIFINAYGPTEATGISMYYRVDERPSSPDVRIPLGKPCENTEVMLLDENKRPVPLGEPGEIYIKGVCLAKGYLNDHVRTNEVFIDNPLNPMQGERVYKTGDYAKVRADGNFEFLGRKDNQVKYMGYRIELTDIEQSLVSIAGVRDAGVILAESESTGLEELVAFLEADDSVPLSEIMAETKKKLPFYMVPKNLIRIGRIPRSDGGKIGRASLFAHHKEINSRKGSSPL